MTDDLIEKAAHAMYLADLDYNPGDGDRYTYLAKAASHVLGGVACGDGCAADQPSLVKRLRASSSEADLSSSS